MARIKPADDLVPDDRPYPILGQIRRHRPAMDASWEQVKLAVRTTGTLEPRLRELVRLRIGFHNQCRSCMSARFEPDVVSEDLVCSLERPHEAPDLSAAERSALRFADLFATNHLAITEDVYDDLRAWFDEGELVELGMLCAYLVGWGRLMATWNVTEGLPEGFRDSDDVLTTPWGQEQVVIVPRS